MKMGKSILSANEAVVALVCYCFSSISMVVLNKYVLSSHQFGMNFLLLALQSIVCVLFLRVSKSADLLTYRELNRRDAQSWLPVSVLLVLMIYTGSKSLQYLPVAIFTVFKNITIIAIALGERSLFANEITPLMWLSFILIVTSSILGGYSDLAFNATGYVWMVINCVGSACYGLYMRLSIRSHGFTDFDSVYYNNMLAIPIMLGLSILSEDWSGFMRNYFAGGVLADSRNSLFVGIAFSSIAAFSISYCTAWSMRTASSTSYSMVGALNKLPLAISGMLFFSTERRVNAGNLLSILIAFASGILYSLAQIRKNSMPKKMLPVSEPLVNSSTEGKTVA